MSGIENEFDGPMHPTSETDISDPKPSTNEVEPRALTLEKNLMEVAKMLGLPEDASIDEIKSAIAKLQENQQ